MTPPAAPYRFIPCHSKEISVQPGGAVPFVEALWHEARNVDAGISYEIPAGLLTASGWITADFLTDQPTDLVFNLEFFEPGNERPFILRFSLLPRTQARLRLSLEAARLNRWRYFREGGLLKPTTDGYPVEPARVERIFLKVLHKGNGPARWCMTPLTYTAEEPAVLTDPVIVGGPLLDSLGQATFRDWPGKTSDEATLFARLRQQASDAPQQAFPAAYSRWGGWKERRVEATGFFHTHHDGRRWWLVDPEGYLFWSVGPDCVLPKVEANYLHLEKALAGMMPKEGAFADCYIPEYVSDESETYDYLVAHFIHAFGAEAWRQRWSEIAYSLLRRIGFNSCGNWSGAAAASAARFPYVFPMRPLPQSAWRVPRVFRDFPDVFDPAFEAEADAFARQLAPLANDPALIGYFLMNEPEWGFARILPAEGMLVNTPACETRRALAAELRKQYATETALARAWGEGVTFASIAEGHWALPFTETARADLRAFSTRMVARLYDSLVAACRRADPHHLNLGARFAFAPEDWIADGIHSFDVFSINCYREEADDHLGAICERMNIPAIIGEWHFGAIDAGLPAPGIGHARNQEERGVAYRYFIEQTAARPWCVGAHWFTLYDQSAVGRNDGENYNIGFIDVCHRLYEPLEKAARATHERLYGIAAGETAPVSQRAEIAPRLNL